MDINKEIFRIVNNLIVLENYLDYEFKYNYNRLNFLRNKRNSDDNNKFNAQILNALYNLENINYSSFIINNENEDKEFLHKKFNYIYLNKDIQKYNLIYNNKEFLNNEKEIIKNNKHVYMNKYIIKEKNIKIKKSQNKRSSKYRGVSKNGIGWQVLMMYKRNKSYIGTYYSEELAARIYDIISIKRMGIKAKTNFLYNNEQISKILKANFDFKSSNISKFILELIN
jgi:hypothetical protein